MWMWHFFYYLSRISIKDHTNESQHIREQLKSIFCLAATLDIQVKSEIRFCYQ